jgi:hypothetical protein
MFQIYGTADIQPWNYPKPIAHQDPVRHDDEQAVLSTNAGEENA